MSRQSYPSDLTDQEWQQLKPLLPQERNPIGTPRTLELREVVNALLYVVDNGIKWRALPHDFPPWQTVYGYFRRWSQTGVWQDVHQALRRTLRIAAGHEPEASLGLIESQSVRMAQKGALNRALMATKSSKGENVI